MTGPPGGFELAQVNIARLKLPLNHPATRDFVDNLIRINALAESQPGFLWRPIGGGDPDFDVEATEDPMLIVNLSVWSDPERLAAFVYRTAHREVMRRRREWFEVVDTYMALWWVPAGQRPTQDEALARLRRLDAHGPTAEAFTFREPHPAPDQLGCPAAILDECA